MRFLKVLLSVLIVFMVSACSPKKEASNEIRVGTISGPETQLMQIAKAVAYKDYGLKVDIVEFTDYTSPNQALEDGDIDINMFQHLPYLEAAVDAHHYDIVPVAKTFIYPMGIYSLKINQLSQLRNGGMVGIPDDPTNEARALLLLQKAGLITLKPGAGVLATPLDVLKNPKQLQFKELGAPDLPRALPDLDIGVINSNYAIVAGYHPQLAKEQTKDHRYAIFLEGKDSAYANIFVARKADVNSPKVKELIEAFQSQAVLSAANAIFHGDAIKAW